MDEDFILELVSSRLFGLFCHQDPLILMQVNGQPVLLCPRCSGLHIGFVVSLIYFSFEKLKRVRFSGLAPQIICVAAVLLMALEWLLGRLSLLTPTLSSRLISGLVAGAAAGVLALFYTRNYLSRYQPVKSFTSVSVLGVVCLALMSGMALLGFGSWRLLTISLMIVVLTNILFVFYAVFQRLRSIKNLKTENLEG